MFQNVFQVINRQWFFECMTVAFAMMVVFQDVKGGLPTQGLPFRHNFDNGKGKVSSKYLLSNKKHITLSA